jgi:hypothetical protein
MTPQLWQPGDHITVRTIWFGRVSSVHPLVVVEDTGSMLVGYLTPGQVFMRPFRASGEQARVPRGEWSPGPEVWRASALRIFFEGEAHSVLVFLGAEGVDRWYVNLEDPPRRTAMGIDTRDQMADVVFTGDLSSYRWKDLDELEEALEHGVVTASEAASIRAEGERVIEWMQRGHPAVQERWHSWRPSPGWGVPRIHPEWERV